MPAQCPKKFSAPSQSGARRRGDTSGSDGRAALQERSHGQGVLSGERGRAHFRGTTVGRRTLKKESPDALENASSSVAAHVVALIACVVVPLDGGIDLPSAWPSSVNAYITASAAPPPSERCAASRQRVTAQLLQPRCQIESWQRKSLQVSDRPRREASRTGQES